MPFPVAFFFFKLKFVNLVFRSTSEVAVAKLLNISFYTLLIKMFFYDL